MRRWPWIAAGLALAQAACQQAGAPPRVEAPPDSAAGEVAFELGGGAALLVPVHVNGQGPFQLVLDTGATLTCLDREVVRRLDLPPARGVVGVGAGVEGTGEMSLVRIDSIRVGGARAEGVTGCALDLRHIGDVGLDIDGLLGLDFLRAYRVTLDFRREVLLLQPAE